LKILEAQETNGFITKVDVKRVKVTVTNLESELSNVTTNLDNLYNILKVQLNLPMETQLTLDNVVNEQEILKEIELSSNPYANRTELLLLSKQSELYELQKDNINSGYYPSINAYGRYSYQAFRQSFNFFDTSQDWFKMAAIGVSIKIPVFDGFAKKYRAEQSEVKIQQTQFETEQLKVNVSSEIKNAKSKLKTSLEQFNSQKANIVLAEEVYKQTEQRYKEGFSPITDLLNAETSLKESQNNYLRSLLQINLAKLDLKKAEGLLIK
jgi:outer membrane protein TolC